MCVCVIEVVALQFQRASYSGLSLKRNAHTAKQVIALAEACWHHNPSQRPTMAAVAGRLRQIINGIKGRRRAEQQRRLGSSGGSAGALTASSSPASSLAPAGGGD